MDKGVKISELPTPGSANGDRAISIGRISRIGQETPRADLGCAIWVRGSVIPSGGSELGSRLPRPALSYSQLLSVLGLQKKRCISDPPNPLLS